MLQNAIQDGMVQQNTTRPHFTYADRVIKYLIHPELIASEVIKFSIVEQCLLVRDFMNRNQPEQYVRAEQMPRDTALPAVTFTQKIINKNVSQQQEQQQQEESPPTTQLNNVSTPVSPPSSPLIYPSDSEAETESIPPITISAATFTNKLPSSCDKYLQKRKKPLHYLAAAGKVVVLCDVSLQDLEIYIPHLNLKKLIKYIITAGMNAPPTTQNADKSKYILKSKVWKPSFQRWVINSLIDSGSSDVLGHSAKHITNIQRGADTTINVLTYYMRLTTRTSTKEKKKKKKMDIAMEGNELTTPSWECIENGPKMFTLKGESSDEDGDNINEIMSDDEDDKEGKKKKKIAQYYSKWSVIYGEDVSDLSAFMIQKGCIEKYEICCDIARYYLINDNWKKAKKWFNRATRWYLRVDQKNLMSQKHLHFNEMISNERYEWKRIATIIRVLNVIVNTSIINRNEQEDIMMKIERIVRNKRDDIDCDNQLCVLLCDVWKDKQRLEPLSVSLLNVWLNEMRVNRMTQSAAYLQVFIMIYAMYCGNGDGNMYNIYNECLMTKYDAKYCTFYLKLMDNMYAMINNEREKKEMYQKMLRNIEFMHMHMTNIDIQNIEWMEQEDRNGFMHDSIAMDIDDDIIKEEAKDKEEKCWSEQIMCIQNSDEMSELLSELINCGDKDKYNMAINWTLHKCCCDDIDSWMDVLKNVMLSMMSKYNRDQIAFIRLVSEIAKTEDIQQFMQHSLCLKLNGIAVPSCSGLYALFRNCFSKSNAVLIFKLCNHLYTVIFEKRREFEVNIKKMKDANEIYHEKYAVMMYRNYLEQESLLNLFINHNKLVSNIDELIADTGSGIHQHIQVLYRYMCDLCANIKFNNNNMNCNNNMNYLYRVTTNTNIKLFCKDATTQFLFDLFCGEIIDDFINILSPLIVALIHCIYCKSKHPKYQKQSKYLFLSFKGNKYYEFILISAMQIDTLIDDAFTQLITRNMNKLLTFIYFVYYNIWNCNKNKNTNNLNILHKCCDVLLAKNHAFEALQLLIDETNCVYSNHYNETYISSEYGFIFENDKIFSHFIYLCCLNGHKIEAVLLWQLSTDPNRIKYAANIIKNELSVKDLERHIHNHPNMDIFECIWEPLIFCQLKEKYAKKSKIINQKLDQYLACFEMGTHPKLKANKLCDFVFNNLLLK